MGIPESQLAIIWKAIGAWMGNKHVSPHHFSLQIAGLRDPYPPARIAKGIQDGSVPISSEFLHRCVWMFSLTSARQWREDDHLTDEECIGLLTTILMENNSEGKSQL